ncbi:ABC transporter ATP-binding protein [Ensifer adhaerens]|jgi:branched-chain amino acid transport system ATP-binding protein|uniref:ABC transporter ATP-binding protein n=1 Tax=Ensifer adhaerens TaxID=106592 RepID=UPI002030956A|nr:ATP-binding cassette domain-containing protein [Ensifer adhaerens]
MTAVLKVQALAAGYGNVEILHRLSLEMGSHGNIGLFGPNGHGKTTLLRALSGLVSPCSGRIEFYGEDITGWTPRRIVDAGLIHVPQGNRLFPDLTIGECISLGAYSKRSRSSERQNRDTVLSIFPKLRQRWDQKVRTLSGGERQMVSISTALMASPRLLILDEPTLGLSPKLKEDLCLAIQAISNNGLPLIVVEQDIEFLLQLANHLFFVNHGEVASEIRPGQGVDHSEIMSLYFGH